MSTTRNCARRCLFRNGRNMISLIRETHHLLLVYECFTSLREKDTSRSAADVSDAVCVTCKRSVSNGASMHGFTAMTRRACSELVSNVARHTQPAKVKKTAAATRESLPCTCSCCVTQVTKYGAPRLVPYQSTSIHGLRPYKERLDRKVSRR